VEEDYQSDENDKDRRWR